jgi:hypothetical protein
MSFRQRAVNQAKDALGRFPGTHSVFFPYGITARAGMVKQVWRFAGYQFPRRTTHETALQ